MQGNQEAADAVYSGIQPLTAGNLMLLPGMDQKRLEGAEIPLSDVTHWLLVIETLW